jgi:hypothetical protein
MPVLQHVVRAQEFAYLHAVGKRVRVGEEELDSSFEAAVFNVTLPAGDGACPWASIAIRSS